jgi:hypothetical protein
MQLLLQHGLLLMQQSQSKHAGRTFKGAVRCQQPTRQGLPLSAVHRSPS